MVSATDCSLVAHQTCDCGARSVKLPCARALVPLWYYYSLELSDAEEFLLAYAARALVLDDCHENFSPLSTRTESVNVIAVGLLLYR